MHTFAGKPKATQQATSAKATPSNFGHSNEVDSILHLQRTIGNQAVQRLLHSNAKERRAALTSTATSYFGQDSNRIPLHPPASRAMQMRLAISKRGDKGDKSEQSPTASRHTGTLAAPMLQRSFEDEPVSSGANADTLVTRIQGILREWKSECQEGVNDFVHAELATAIDGLGSGSWPTFLLALVGNTIWAAAAFVPLAAGARAVFAVSMAGIAVAAAPTIPAASSEGENLTKVAEMMKGYYGDVFTQLLNQVGPKVTSYVRAHGQVNGNQALISFLQDTFRPEQINTTGTPNINGNAVRTATHAYATDLLARYRRQVVPIGPATVTNVTDPIDRQITTQTGVVWADRDDGRHYLTQIFIENSSIGGIQRGTSIQFRMFIDDALKDAAIERARRTQPRGIQTLPWSAIRGIPAQAPASAARE